MLSQGKPSGKAVVAVARELSGFIWSIAREIEEKRGMDEVTYKLDRA
ncbi:MULTISPECIES: hypothetical protein [unclassified Paenibacillus]|nr:hypothetical protein [Paenibacillus sp. RC343]